jgi:hypothetical protein
VQWAFQCLKDRGGLVQIDTLRQLKIDRRDPERLWSNALWWSGESDAQTPIHRLLERLTRTAVLPLEEARYVVVDGKSCSHIMMLSYAHLDV